jgi:hypothetical protein
MNILVIAPLHDLPTSISSVAVNHLLKWIRKNKIRHTVLRFAAANRISVSFANALNRALSNGKNGKRYTAVFYYGHGENDRLGDAFMDVLPIISTKNIHKFSGMVIYTMACLSGLELGPISIEKGVKAYFGQTVRYFASLNTMGREYNFMTDWYELINIIPKSLMMGNTSAQALHDYENLANTLYAKYLLLKNELNQYVLYSNARHLELYGDPHAKIL